MLPCPGCLSLSLLVYCVLCPGLSNNVPVNIFVLGCRSVVHSFFLVTSYFVLVLSVFLFNFVTLLESLVLCLVKKKLIFLQNLSGPHAHSQPDINDQIIRANMMTKMAVIDILFLR